MPPDNHRKSSHAIVDRDLVKKLGSLVCLDASDTDGEKIIQDLKSMVAAFEVLSDFQGESLAAAASPVVTHTMPLRADVVHYDNVGFPSSEDTSYNLDAKAEAKTEVTVDVTNNQHAETVAGGSISNHNKDIDHSDGKDSNNSNDHESYNPRVNEPSVNDPKVLSQREAIFANAPHAYEYYFTVPKVVE